MLINKTKARLLQAIGRYEYLSAVQLTKLLYGNSLTLVQANLSELLAAQFVQALPYSPVTSVSPGGRVRRVYTLDQGGHDYLKTLGIVPAGRFRTSERAKRQPSTLIHTLAANDLLILTHLFCKQHDQFQLERFETESELKRHPVYLENTSPKVAVIPDAWVLLAGGENEYGIAWELDRATENRTVFREKIRMLAYYSQGPYADEFQTDALTIAFVATEGGARRVESMLVWTEAELTNLGAQALASTVFFAAFDPAKADPEEVFLSPIWRRPFTITPVALVED